LFSNKFFLSIFQKIFSNIKKLLKIEGSKKYFANRFKQNAVLATQHTAELPIENTYINLYCEDLLQCLRY
jgi:hypothetical protein